MNQKPSFGIISRIFLFIKSFITALRPRYQLSMDSHSFDIVSKKTIYCFKVYGDHSFVKLAYDEFKNNNNILYSINPNDLIRICVNEQLHLHKSAEFRITELLRDNKYLISDGNKKQIFSGEEICENILFMERIDKIDLYKIAYSTGFNNGRNLAKAVSKSSIEAKEDNIVSLTLLKK